MRKDSVRLDLVISELFNLELVCIKQVYDFRLVQVPTLRICLCCKSRSGERLGAMKCDRGRGAEGGE